MNADPGAARRRRTAGIGVVAVAAALLTSSCAAGQVAQTADQRPTIPGVNAQVGSIGIRDLYVVAPIAANSFPKGSALRLTGNFVNNGTAADELTDITSPSVTGWAAFSTISAGDQVADAATASPSISSAPPSSTVAPSTASSAPSTGTSSSTGTSTPTSATPPPAAPSSALPQPLRTVAVTAGSRTTYGAPDSTGSLLLIGTKSTLFPGTSLTVTLTFAKAGAVTVTVPIQITSSPTQAVVEAPSGADTDDPGN